MGSEIDSKWTSFSFYLNAASAYGGNSLSKRAPGLSQGQGIGQFDLRILTELAPSEHTLLAT